MNHEQPPMLPAQLPGEGPKRAERIIYPENPRYRRIRFLSVLMDQSIVLPSGYRIGLDPVIGLFPGIGDGLGAMISCYLVYEAARLGLAKRVLARMMGNIVMETAVGAFPVLGDIFDAVWKANMRNLRLIDRYYHPSLPERPAGRIWLWMLLVTGLFIAGNVVILYLVVKLVLAMLSI